MNKILVTGCSGFLASHLLALLKRDGQNKICGITEVPDFETPGVEVVQLDIRRRDELSILVKDFRPDITYHLAAVTNVAFSWQNPHLTYEVNFMGSLNLLEALLPATPSARLVIMSSAEVYKNGMAEPMSEQWPIQVQNPYALSKLAMEMLGDLYWRASGLSVCKIRAFNFTGPGQDRKFAASAFAQQIAAIEKGEREAVIHVGNLEAIRDFSDVRDMARYVQVIGQRGRSGEVYNLGSGRAISIRQLLDILLAHARTAIRVEVDAEKIRPLDNPSIRCDCSRLASEFGLRPEIAMEQTLLDLLNYWRGLPG